MAGGFSTPKKDEQLKVSGGQAVKTAQILVRGINTYKAGKNVKGAGTLFAACTGKVYFTRKKTPHGKLRTFINVLPVAEAKAKQA
jgi:ribosomal protein L27